MTVAIERRVAAKTAAGECLISDCTCESEVRGLCRDHYNKFIYRKRRMSDKAFARFEANAIKLGLILATGEMTKISDEFTKAEK